MVWFRFFLVGCFFFFQLVKPKRLNVSISFLSVVCVCPSAFLLQGEKKQQSALQKGGGGGVAAPLPLLCHCPRKSISFGTLVSGAAVRRKSNTGLFREEMANMCLLYPKYIFMLTAFFFILRKQLVSD